MISPSPPPPPALQQDAINCLFLPFEYCSSLDGVPYVLIVFHLPVLADATLSINENNLDMKAVEGEGVGLWGEDIVLNNWRA